MALNFKRDIGYKIRIIQSQWDLTAIFVGDIQAENEQNYGLPLAVKQDVIIKGSLFDHVEIPAYILYHPQYGASYPSFCLYSLNTIGRIYELTISFCTASGMSTVPNENVAKIKKSFLTLNPFESAELLFDGIRGIKQKNDNHELYREAMLELINKVVDEYCT